MSRVDEIGQRLLKEGKLVDVPTWQALPVEGKPQGKTWELCDLSLWLPIPHDVQQLQEDINPNLPWAENHFQERVCGVPLNPGETFTEWPWYRGNVEQFKEGGGFSHTYMERYWPKHVRPGMTHEFDYSGMMGLNVMEGIRFEYGDLNDVVTLLAKQPTTRQAYLPVFFPEDTGAVHGERVPCTLGYLFLMREGKLNVTYYIRSCDFYRHFRDDVYLTARLCQWVLEKLRQEPERLAWDTAVPGRLTMHIGSLHVFEGDLPKLRREYENR